MFKQNVSLKTFNTFGIDVKATSYLRVERLEQLSEVLKEVQEFFVLSGGSNILLVDDLELPVLHLDLKGIEVLSESSDRVEVKAWAGENWHEFVLWTLSKNLGGLENLSLIPGNVGTSPMQNIGAYGVEIKDHFVSLEAMEISTGQVKTFDREACAFGYRESVFKNELKGQFIILNVTFALRKSGHEIRTAYGAIQSELEHMGVSEPNIHDVSKAVIAIRQSKLPDPKDLGNSGSFFKNPVVTQAHFEGLQSRYPEIPHYPAGPGKIKVPAGWLVEQSGFKGKRFGDAGVHEKQALVLVNYGKATGREIFALAQKIQKTVWETFQIELVMEVNVLP